jgi:hypothetical protein
MFANPVLAIPEMEAKLGLVAEATGDVYRKSRDEAVALGAKVLPDLLRMATTDGVGWKTQLMARIVYERIERMEALEGVLTHDWKSYPPYAKPWLPRIRVETNSAGEKVSIDIPPPPGHVSIPMTGQSSLMGQHVLPVLREAGLWYYYIEQVWKQTGEGPPAMKFDHLFMERWVGWCAAVVKEQPEKIWWARVVADRLETSDFMDWRDRDLFKALLESGESDTVHFLVRRFDDYFRADAKGLDESNWMWRESYPLRFMPIFGMADESHVGPLGEHIQSHPLLHPHLGKLEKVRKRPPNDETKRLRFRLGANWVESLPEP